MDRRISASRTAALLGGAAERTPAYLGIADGLRLLISDGRIPTGTRLPSERELTEALEVSRTTVTRAYAHLKERGYLVSKQGSGSVTRIPGTHGRATDSLLSPGGRDADQIDLACAAPIAPFGVEEAYAAAMAELPAYLQDTGYYPSGLPQLRQAIAGRYTERGLPTDAEQILVTSGALAAVAIAGRAFLGAGDRVLTESPTYPNAIATLRHTGARVSGADIGASGWAATSLEEELAQLKPKLAYLIPDFQNPTGLLMSDEQRAELAHTLRRVGTLALVDETLAEMRIDDVELPLPFAAHSPGTVTVGSASKTFWGGLRIGWLRAPADQMDALVAARLSLDLGAALLEQLALVHLMERQDEVLEVRRGMLTQSRSALVTALANDLPSWCFRVPAGGQSLWCELPRPVSSRLVSAAEAVGVLLAPGPAFAPEGGLERYVRMPFTRSPAQLTRAVARIAEVWDSGLAEPARRSSGPTLVA